jgi:hypothetical protein
MISTSPPLALASSGIMFLSSPFIPPATTPPFSEPAPPPPLRPCRPLRDAGEQQRRRQQTKNETRTMMRRKMPAMMAISSHVAMNGVDVMLVRWTESLQ